MSKIFGQRLKMLRLEKGLYQADLAQELNVKQNTISDWENGKTEPTIDQIIELAYYFDVSTDFLLGIEPKNNNKKFA